MSSFPQHHILSAKLTKTIFVRATYTIPSNVDSGLNIRSNLTRGLLNPLHFNGSLSVSVNLDQKVTDARLDVHIVGSDAVMLKRLNLCFHEGTQRRPGIAIYVRCLLHWCSC